MWSRTGTALANTFSAGFTLVAHAPIIVAVTGHSIPPSG
jgi:hypothetical protein